MKKRIIFWSVLFVLVFGASLYFGAYTLSFPLSTEAKRMVIETRLPRLIASLFVGAMLGTGGVILRQYTQNDLADPSLLGVASGSQLGLVLLLWLYPQAPYWAQQILSIIGSAGLLWALFYVQQKVHQKQTFILFGFALSALITSIVTMIATIHHFNQFLTQWSSGGLQLTTWGQVLWLAIAFVIGLPLLVRIISPLHLYATNPEMAQLLGVDMKQFHRRVMWLLALYIGVATSIVGNVIFFGLMIATLSMRTGAQEKAPYRGLWLGALMMMFSDLIARVWSAPEETSLVAVIAVMATPIFFYLVRKKVS